jgi:hypothetical protein
VTRNNLSLTNTLFLPRKGTPQPSFLRIYLGTYHLERLSSRQLEAILCALERWRSLRSVITPVDFVMHPPGKRPWSYRILVISRILDARDLGETPPVSSSICDIPSHILDLFGPD